MEIKIKIPDNYELIKDGDTFIVQEKIQIPKVWKEIPIKIEGKEIEEAKLTGNLEIGISLKKGSNNMLPKSIQSDIVY